MAGELIVKNGLRVSGSTIIVGSISATSFTGSFSGSITNAVSASYAATASVLLGSVTSASYALSSSFSSTASYWSGSINNVNSASFASTSSFPWFQTGSNIAYVGGNILVNTTTNAGFKLDVNGTTRFTGDSYVATGDFLLDNDRPIRWKDSGGTFRRAMLITAANDFQFGPVDTGWGATTYVKAGGALQLIVNGASGTFATALTINTSSNVAVGTTSPTSRLHVKGSGTTSATTALRIENANASASLVVLDDRQTRITSEGAALYVEGAGISPFTQNIAEFRYAGNGNSLIIANISGKSGLTTSTNLDLNINPNGTGTTVFLQGKQVRFFNSSNNSNIALQNNGATGQARLDFITGSTTIMSITSSGNVGIGTTTPAARLQVGGTPNDSIAFDADHTLFNGVNARFPGRVIVGASSTQYPKIMYNAVPLSSSNSWSYAANDTAWAISMGGSNRMGFEYVSAGTAGNTFSTWNTIMSLVSGSNNVGIGTTTPAEKLEINGNLKFTTNGTISTPGTIYVSPATAQTYLNYADRYLLVDGWANSYVSLIAEATNPLEIRSGGNTNQLHLTTGGNVGVGTASSTARLQVKGSGTTSSTTALRIEDANTSASLVVRDDSYVGIGTATPTVSLAVYSGSTGLNFNPNIATISSTGVDIKLVANGQNIFRGLDNWTGTWSDSAVTSYFQTGRYNGNTAFSTLNGAQYNRLAFLTTALQITNIVSSVTPPVNYFQIDNNNTNLLSVTTTGRVGINNITPSVALDVSGSGRFTSNLTVTGSIIAASFTGSLSGSATNAVSASFATTASYWSGSILNATSASFASTASFYGGSVTSASFALTASRVNTLNQNVLITGSLTVGATSPGSSENTLTLGPRDNGGEGGQLMLQAPGGTYTSASMLDNYQNKFRVLRGTNAGSDAFKMQIDMETGQVQIPNYNSPTAFTGAPVNSLATDTNGNLLTVQGYSGIVTINTMPPVNFDIQNGIIVNVF